MSPVRRQGGHHPRSLVVGCVCGVALALVGFAGTAWADISATEGMSFSGPVANVGGCSLSGASISWGDGTPNSAGVANGSNVNGTHTYAEEGTFNGRVSYTCFNFANPQPATFQATVYDAALTGAGRNSAGTAGQSLTAVVAHFTDANPAAGLGDFSAQVTWGDGSTSAGSVTAAAGGGFDVTGTHIYAAAGSYPVGTSIADIGGSTATANATAQIAQPPPPSGAPPAARFTFAPASACREDNVTFDAAGSGGGGNQLTQYRWTFANVAEDVHSRNRRGTIEKIVTTTPTLSRRFGAYATSVGEPFVKLPGSPLLAEFRVLRPPVTATLEVVDSAGRTASTTRTVIFANPDERLDYIVKFVDAHGVPIPKEWNATHVTLCQKHQDAAEAFGALLLPLNGGLELTARSAVAQVTCANPLLDCTGVLDVRRSSRNRRGHRARSSRRRTDRNLLGRAAFVVPAGQTIKVTVKLNRRGRALAHAHKLRTAKLRLSSFRPKGRIVTTTKTVRLRRRRR